MTIGIVASVVVGLLQASSSAPQTQAVSGSAVRVAICQMVARDGEIDENLARAAEQVRRAASTGSKVCVFPELIDVGFGDIVKATTGDVPLAFPIPGRTTERLGEIARRNGVWISTALLEKVPGGAYDTNVIFDTTGRVVHKRRKAFVYPAFAGTTAFQGNYLDMQAVDSPWGPLAVMNCADISSAGRRRLIADQNPALVLVNFANPQANLLAHCADLARECGCPVVGANMVFASGANHGGRSQFVAADGRTLWQAGREEVVKSLDLALPTGRPARLPVDAGRVQTLRWPQAKAQLTGRTVKDWPELKVVWTKVAGPDEVTFGDPLASATTVSFSAPGVYVLALTATCAGGSGTDRVCINVLPPDGHDPNLAGYWPFDGKPDDLSGFKHHAMLQGATFSTDVAPTGQANAGSLSVTPTGYAFVPQTGSPNAPSLATVTLWVKVRKPPVMWPDRNKNPVGLLGKGLWWKENYALGMGDYWYLFGRGFSGLQVAAVEDVVRTSGQWHHIAAVLNARRQEGRLYIDGRLHQVARCGADPSGGVNTEPLCFGRFTPKGLGLDGLLDDIRVYTRALSDEEVATLVPNARVQAPAEVTVAAQAKASVGEPVALVGTWAGSGAAPGNLAAAWCVWWKVLGPGQAQFDNAFSPRTSVRFTAPGSYLLEFRASDGLGAAWDTVRVDVSATGGSESGAGSNVE